MELGSVKAKELETRGFTPVGIFFVMSYIDALPIQWRRKEGRELSRKLNPSSRSKELYIWIKKISKPISKLKQKKCISN